MINASHPYNIYYQNLRYDSRLRLDCGLNHLMSDQTKPSALWTVTLQSAK